MTLRDDLIAAKALIDRPEKWCKGIVTGQNCTLWAVSAITGPTRFIRWNDARDALARHVPKQFSQGFGPGNTIINFNDDPDTTHDDVMRLFDRAIANAEATS